MTRLNDTPAPGTFPSPPELQLHALLATGDGITVATAESCTGGHIAHRITSIAGSSEYFLGGVVAYANSAKRDLLGVSADTLASVGAVSPETAVAMAAGARRMFGAEIAVSSTGIAGPGGATARKPVGLVYLALADDSGVAVEEHHFAGDRTEVVEAATQRGLEMLVDAATRLSTRKSQSTFEDHTEK